MKRIVCAILMAVLLCASTVAEWEGVWVSNHTEEDGRTIYVINIEEGGRAFMHIISWENGEVVIDLDMPDGEWIYIVNSCYITFGQSVSLLLEKTKEDTCIAQTYLYNKISGLMKMKRVPSEN